MEHKTYDADVFAKDLDQALNLLRVMMTSNVASHLPLVDPRLSPDMSLGEATWHVCLALITRYIPEDLFNQYLERLLAETREILIEKNANYGDSALAPLRIFSKASAREQLLVRMDDKVSRLERGQAAGEDVTRDLLGYIVLLFIAESRGKNAAADQQ